MSQQDSEAPRCHLSYGCISCTQQGFSTLVLGFVVVNCFVLLYCSLVHLNCMHHQQKGNIPHSVPAIAGQWDRHLVQARPQAGLELASSR